MPQQLFNLYKIFEKIKWVGMLISGLTIFFMMFYTTLDVFMRNVFNSSNLYTYEFSQYYFMPLAVLPALAYAFGRGVMPRIELVVSKLKDTHQRIVTIILLIIEIVLFTVLTIYGTKYAIAAFQNSISFSAGGENYLLGPVILFAPFSFLLITIECVFLLIKNIMESKSSYMVIPRKLEE